VQSFLPPLFSPAGKYPGEQETKSPSDWSLSEEDCITEALVGSAEGDETIGDVDCACFGEEPGNLPVAAITTAVPRTTEIIAMTDALIANLGRLKAFSRTFTSCPFLICHSSRRPSSSL